MVGFVLVLGWEGWKIILCSAANTSKKILWQKGKAIMLWLYFQQKNFDKNSQKTFSVTIEKAFLSSSISILKKTISIVKWKLKELCNMFSRFWTSKNISFGFLWFCNFWKCSIMLCWKDYFDHSTIYFHVLIITLISTLSQGAASLETLTNITIWFCHAL